MDQVHTIVVAKSLAAVIAGQVSVIVGQVMKESIVASVLQRTTELGTYATLSDTVLLGPVDSCAAGLESVTTPQANAAAIRTLEQAIVLNCNVRVLIHCVLHVRTTRA